MALVLAFAACSAPEDGDGVDGGVDAPPGTALGPIQYPMGRTQSPLTPDLVEQLRAVHAKATGSASVFAKIGDSHTVSTSYLGCFAGTSVDLGGRDLGATVAHFAAGDAAGTTPYQRVSLAAKVGWSAFAVLAGTPSPLEQELAAIGPAFATVMFGTNDIGFMRIDRYGQNLAAIADSLLAQGIIPVFSTIPPRDDSAAADAQVPRYNAVARGIAQTRGVPLVDLHRELLPLADHGLAGDGVHLQTASGGACRLTAAGLTEGNNVRNLVTLEALDRLRRTVLAGEAAPDAEAPRLAGTGAPGDPFVIGALPFADRRDTRTDGADAIAVYGCAAQDERGNELYYKLELTEPALVRAYVLDADADVDIHLLAATPTAEACVARGDTTVEHQLAPGTYYLVADTYAGNAGDYTIVVLAD